LIFYYLITGYLYYCTGIVLKKDQPAISTGFRCKLYSHFIIYRFTTCKAVTLLQCPKKISKQHHHPHLKDM
jgi:hypothetical protein